MILDIGHVAMQVPDVDASVEFATTVLGLHEVERVDGTAYLTIAGAYPSMRTTAAHHVLSFRQGAETALDHVGLYAKDSAALQTITHRAQQAGGTVEPLTDLPGVAEAILVTAPSGHAFAVYPAMDRVECTVEHRGVMPERLGHVNLWAKDAPALMQFWVDAFDFKVSDWVQNHTTGRKAGFARCHLEHHTLATITGEVDGIYHYAFEMPDVGALGRIGDVLASRGEGLLWGPVRHGAGDNAAVYFRSPDGLTVEAYSNMQKISDPGWEPRIWKDLELPMGANAWGPQGGPERMAFNAGLVATEETQNA